MSQKDAGQSLPKTEKLSLAVPSNTLTGLSSGVSLSEAIPEQLSTSASSFLDR